MAFAHHQFFVLFLMAFCHYITPSGAILCRTGVDHIGGPVADCGSSNQCLNTTSPRATVYSCDHAGICETILNMRDGCVKDGQNMVCCCSTADGCNYGLREVVVVESVPESDEKVKGPGASGNALGKILLPLSAKSMGGELCTTI
ncbi:hypothetical protein GPALN_005612 [Globodera pallida]|nr:hypothetical protein GPALN_005612 [Globodera pallida]